MERLDARGFASLSTDHFGILAMDRATG